MVWVKLSWTGEAVVGGEAVIEALGGCNGHPIGWLRGANDSVINHAPATFNPSPETNEVAVSVLRAKMDWTDSDAEKVEGNEGNGGSGGRSIGNSPLSSGGAVTVGGADAQCVCLDSTKASVIEALLIESPGILRTSSMSESISVL